MPYSRMIDRIDAGALIPEDAAREIIQNMPEGSVIMRMARRLPNMARAQQRMPVLSALPMAYFVDEVRKDYPGDDSKRTTEMAWANKYLNAAEIAVIVPIPQNVLSDADYDIWGQVRPHLVAEMGRVFDAAVLHGVNAPAVWPDDIVTAATAAGNSLTVGDIGDLYDDIMGFGGVISLVEQDGYLVNGHIASIGLRAALRGLRSAVEGVLIFNRSVQAATQYELDGTPIDFPRNGALDDTAASLISGDWTQVVYSIREDITYKLLTEAVITDPTDNNRIIYNLPQQDMVALRVTMRLAWQVPNPINRIQETEANRYPLAVLIPA